MLKVLVADRSEMFCNAVSEQLAYRFHVRCCQTGRQVLEMCYGFEPDVLILDLEMPGIDGISILHTLRSSGKSIDVLATTACFYSDYVLQMMVQLGVQFVLPKPCTIAAILSRTQEIAFQRTENAWNAENEVDNLLLMLGLRMSLGGYACVREALLQMKDDNTLPITKVVYPNVARICGGNAKRVERAIRSAVSNAWKNRDDSIWRMYFAPGRDGGIPCPTNSAFIARMSTCLCSKKIG